MTRAIAQLRDPESRGLEGQYALQDLTRLWMHEAPAEWITALDLLIEETTDDE